MCLVGVLVFVVVIVIVFAMAVFMIAVRMILAVVFVVGVSVFVSMIVVMVMFAMAVFVVAVRMILTIVFVVDVLLFAVVVIVVMVLVPAILEEVWFVFENPVEVEAFHVQHVVEMDLRVEGAVDLRGRVHLPNHLFEPFEISRCDEIGIVQENHVRKSNLLLNFV